MRTSRGRFVPEANLLALDSWDSTTQAPEMGSPQWNLCHAPLGILQWIPRVPMALSLPISLLFSHYACSDHGPHTGAVRMTSGVCSWIVSWPTEASFPAKVLGVWIFPFLACSGKDERSSTNKVSVPFSEGVAEAHVCGVACEGFFLAVRSLFLMSLVVVGVHLWSSRGKSVPGLAGRMVSSISDLCGADLDLSVS